jgi:hypothetical protein
MKHLTGIAAIQPDNLSFYRAFHEQTAQSYRTRRIAPIFWQWLRGFERVEIFVCVDSDNECIAAHNLYLRQEFILNYHITSFL